MEPFTVSVNEATQLLSLGRTTVYSLIKEQRLATIKLGRRTLITTQSIRALIEGAAVVGGKG